MVGKQAMRHTDIAMDHHWNLEPSEAVAQEEVIEAGSLNDATLAAINAAVAAAVAEALAAK